MRSDKFISRALFVFNRCLWLYGVVVLLVLVFVDQRVVVFKTLDHLAGTQKPLLEYAFGIREELTPLELKESEHLFLTMKKILPDSLAVWSSLAAVHDLQHDYARALECTGQCLRRLPDSLWFLHNEGVLRFYHGDYDGAKTAFTRALAAKPYFLVSEYPLMAGPKVIYFSGDVEKRQENRLNAARMARLRAYEFLILLAYRDQEYQSMVDLAVQAGQEAGADFQPAFLFFAGAGWGAQGQQQKAAAFFQLARAMNFDAAVIQRWQDFFLSEAGGDFKKGKASLKWNDMAVLTRDEGGLRLYCYLPSVQEYRLTGERPH